MPTREDFQANILGQVALAYATMAGQVGAISKKRKEYLEKAEQCAEQVMRLVGVKDRD